MDYRQLGGSGVRVSVIGLGTNRFGNEALPQSGVSTIIDTAENLGINFIDTSNTYLQTQSEQALGHALKGRRNRFVLGTKFVLPVGNGPNDRGGSRYHMTQAIEDSLRRLKTDRIDLYYVHRWDPLTPIAETMRGLDDLVHRGKVVYVGCSDFAAWQLAHANLLADLRGWSPFVAIQSEYHLLERYVESEVLPYCQAYNIGFVPYYPLAGGFLTGKYRRGEVAPPGSRGESNPRVQHYMTDTYYTCLERLTNWATDRDRSLNELAHAWLLAQPQVCSVISGATTLEQMVSNAKSGNWQLNSEEIGEINTILDA